MNGSSWLRFIGRGHGNWSIGEDTYILLVDKKTLEALAYALAGKAPEKHQQIFNLTGERRSLYRWEIFGNSRKLL